MRISIFTRVCLALLVPCIVATGADLPDGKGKEAVERECSSCHSLDRITALRLTEDGWRSTLRQMAENGASINPQDSQVILAYLVTNLGAHPENKGPIQATVGLLAPSNNNVPAAAGRAPVSFNRDIRPVMSGTCFRCHGPDVSSRMAGMRLDIREEALKPKAKGTPIVPGDPEHSEVVQRIFATDGRIMPPAYAHKELTGAQKELIRRWVAEGAKYEGHWAYQPIARPAVPQVSGVTVLNPIDAFIQARLAKEGLKPSAEANKRTLIRRVTLDLTGLAPEPSQVEAFVRDTSTNAYEKVVDRLLASTAYAEHQAVGWLDAVRYADSAGYHSDGERPMWPYRDYVLKSLRDNKPFDQFTREQLAGDLLPNATMEQKVASAYNRMGRSSAEGGLQPKEYFAKYGADRVRALGANWLGSTFGCAECHDHKFDPILTKDFYSLKAFFSDVKEDGLVADQGPDAFAPKMPVYQPGEKEKIDELIRRIAVEQTDLDRRADGLTTARRQWEADMRSRTADLSWNFQIPTAVSAKSAKLTVDEKGPDAADVAALATGARGGGPGTVIAGGPNPDNDTYTVTLQPGAGRWTYLGIAVDSDTNLAGANISRGSDRFVITGVTAEFSADGSATLSSTKFSLAHSGTTPTVGYPAMAVLDGDPKTGWGFVGTAGRPFLVLRFAEALQTESASKLIVKLHQNSSYRRATIGRFRLALATGTYWPDTTITSSLASPATPGEAPKAPPLMQAIEVSEEHRTAEQSNLIRDAFEYASPDLFAAKAAIAQSNAKLNFLQGAVAQVMVTETMAEPRETRLLPRGNWMDDSGELLQPAIPQFLGKLDTGDRHANRLDLANWLVSPGNPLTARVFVNRLWREFFGTGLSRTIEDFGSQGEAPTNAELLDWLASEFMKPESGNDNPHAWDMRHTIRTIVTSYTYRQTSISTPELDQRDPENRLLARQSRFRVDAEVVRDLALQTSGLLVNKFGGPSVRPYQPDGYLAALNFPKRDWSAGHGDELYRRGIYTFWQRTFLHPTLQNFDAPSREEANVNRVNSNTPLQALDLLNDPTFVEASRTFGQRILSTGGTYLQTQLAWAFNQAVGRRPDAEELKILNGLYEQSLARFQAEPAAARELLGIGDSPVSKNLDAPQLAAMTNVARTILNLHEVITRD